MDALFDAGVDAGTDAGMEAMPDIFEMYDEVLLALRASPDPRTAKTQRLVEQADLPGLFEFVRDDIVMYPDEDNRGIGDSRSRALRHIPQLSEFTYS